MADIACPLLSKVRAQDSNIDLDSRCLQFVGRVSMEGESKEAERQECPWL